MSENTGENTSFAMSEYLIMAPAKSPKLLFLLRTIFVRSFYPKTKQINGNRTELCITFFVSFFVSLHLKKIQIVI